ncbi:MAG: sigma-54 dependent transcriptional regulator [Myxococcales bacterium]|nr:sigma-54 dependent transcriptional regulator [Myxococcales bacterium]
MELNKSHTKQSSKPFEVLVVEDEPEHLASLKRLFEREGLIVHTAASGELALEVLRSQDLTLIISDIMLPGLSGIELLKATKTLRPRADVVVMTAYGSIELAVEAMRAGAYDFIQKPLKATLIRQVVRRALEKQRLAAENIMLRRELAQVMSSGDKTRTIIGRSPAMQATMEMIHQAAPSTATVFLHGESGTGKELLARALHECSPRATKPFVVVNCAALPEAILEAELFGYEKGAFTGASATKEGRIEKAQDGTLFLDEVGELSLPVQAKLLRVLQEGEFERLGSNQTRSIDFRLVSATNRELEQLVQKNEFREDLYYRLNVIGITIAPLRERPEDLALLVNHFLRRFSAKNDKNVLGLSKEAMDMIARWRWPGNVRELENVIERAVVLSRNEILTPEDLPQPLRTVQTSNDPNPIRRESRGILIPIGTKLEDVERELIYATLQETNGDKTLAAQLLGIAARTIYRKLDKLETQRSLEQHTATTSDQQT